MPGSRVHCPLLAGVVVIVSAGSVHAGEQPKIRLSGEVRERIERRTDRNFSPTRGGNDAELSSRVRFRADATFDGPWTAMLEYQYESRVLWTPARNFARGRDDLFQGYVQYSRDDTLVRAGRQIYRASTGRLLATPPWGNLSRSFDGLTVSDGPWTAFLLKLGVNARYDGQERFYGGSYRGPAGETLLLYSFDRPGGLVRSLYTLDHAWRGEVDGWTLEAELALQSGRSRGKDHEAWAAAGSVGRRIGPGWRVFLNLDWASGGEGRDKVTRFDPLYGSTHDLYGKMDLQDWSNVFLVTLGVGWNPSAPWRLLLSLGSLRLANARDGWYSASGTLNRGAGFDYIDPTGRSGSDLGRELNIDASYSPTDDWSLNGGIGVFFPGGFVRNMNGGRALNHTWGYVQARWRF